MTLRIAAVQASSVFLDLDGCVDKALRLIGEAAAEGAGLVAFPETWLPGYPAWLDVCRDVTLWDHAPVKALFGRLRRNSVVVPGPVTEALGSAACEHEMVVQIGVHERVESGPGNGTLYNTALTFDADGSLLQARRKLVPTYAERLVWGPGDGSGLEAVDTQVGRVGNLICWEHWMPLARQALHDSREHVHVSAWPAVREMHLVASRHYAFEGRCFVLACGAILRREDLPDDLEFAADLPPLLLNGGSAIIGPDGALLAGPVFDEETILIADAELGRIAEEQMTLDVTGHYSRPDVFEFRVRTR